MLKVWDCWKLSLILYLIHSLFSISFTSQWRKLGFTIRKLVNGESESVKINRCLEWQLSLVNFMRFKLALFSLVMTTAWVTVSLRSSSVLSDETITCCILIIPGNHCAWLFETKAHHLLDNKSNNIRYTCRVFTLQSSSVCHKRGWRHKSTEVRVPALWSQINYGTVVFNLWPHKSMTPSSISRSRFLFRWSFFIICNVRFVNKGQPVESDFIFITNVPYWINEPFYYFDLYYNAHRLCFPDIPVRVCQLHVQVWLEQPFDAAICHFDPGQIPRNIIRRLASLHLNKHIWQDRFSQCW
jgi:hypothetical protein